LIHSPACLERSRTVQQLVKRTAGETASRPIFHSLGRVALTSHDATRQALRLLPGSVPTSSLRAQLRRRPLRSPVRSERNLIKSHRRPGNPSTFQPSAPLSPLRAMSADKLEALLAIISSGVGEIKHAYASAGEPVPDPDAPYVPDNVEPGVETSKALVVAAALQLIAAVGNPGKILIDAVCGGVRPRGQLESDADVKPMGGKMLVTEALGVVLKLHVPEIVREAGPEVCSKFSMGFAFLSAET
jgi:hypothetical protein